MGPSSPHHRQVEVQEDVHRCSQVVEVPSVPVCPETCFYLFLHPEEEEDHLEEAVSSFPHPAAACLNLAVPGQEVVVLVDLDHHTPARDRDLQLVP